MSAEAPEANQAAQLETETETSGELQTLLRSPAAPKGPAQPQSVPQALTGRIVRLDEGGGPEVEFAGSQGAVAARLAVAVSATQLASAMQTGQSVLLLFENGDPKLPIIVGLIQPALTERLLEAVTATASSGSVPPVIEADADGKRVRVVAQEEIVLECGSASITLRRNGRVVIRGTYVETHSEGTNRIKGGQVRIN